MFQFGKPPAHLQHVELTINIRPEIRARVFQRISDTRLSGQMHDAVYRFMARRQRHHVVPLGDIQSMKVETVPGRQQFEPRLLQGRVVIIVEVINPNDRLTSIQQCLAGMKADKSGGTGDED